MILGGIVGWKKYVFICIKNIEQEVDTLDKLVSIMIGKLLKLLKFNVLLQFEL